LSFFIVEDLGDPLGSALSSRDVSTVLVSELDPLARGRHLGAGLLGDLMAGQCDGDLLTMLIREGLAGPAIGAVSTVTL
jgi:hypothetical protein